MGLAHGIHYPLFVVGKNAINRGEKGKKNRKKKKRGRNRSVEGPQLRTAASRARTGTSRTGTSGTGKRALGGNLRLRIQRNRLQGRAAK